MQMGLAGTSSATRSASFEVFLYADPATHSRSPQMHRAAFAHAGISAQYQAKTIKPAELAQAIEDLRAPTVLGANISLPHKEAALALVDTLTPAAQQIGAINTIINKGGILWGDNTDAAGLLLALQQEQLVPVRGQVVVLGAGGAARAAVYMARRLLQRPLSVCLINRSPERAQALAAQWDQGVQVGSAKELNWDTVSLIINASSAGLGDPEQTPLPHFDFTQLSPSAAIYDMVYEPQMTKLRRDAQAAELRHAGGLSMLAQQARLSFLAWTQTCSGRRAAVDGAVDAAVPYAVFWQALMEPR